MALKQLKLKGWYNMELIQLKQYLTLIVRVKNASNQKYKLYLIEMILKQYNWTAVTGKSNELQMKRIEKNVNAFLIENGVDTLNQAA